MAHPAEVEGYLTFLKAGREALKAARPGAAVGVTTMFLGLRSDPKLITQIQSGMDLVSMTYYPLQADFSVMPVSEVGGQLDAMIRAAGSRMLFVQEAGYPSSPLLGSSEAAQSKFVNELFAAMTRRPDRLYGACYFLADGHGLVARSSSSSSSSSSRSLIHHHFDLFLIDFVVCVCDLMIYLSIYLSFIVFF